MQGSPSRPDDTSRPAPLPPPPPPTTINPWQTYGVPAGYEPRHGTPSSHARYESTDSSSFYESSWLSSSSPSILSPTSPETGYLSTGSTSDFYNQSIWSPRNSIGHQSGQTRQFPPMPRALVNSQGMSSLRIASDAEDLSVKREDPEDSKDVGGEVDAPGEEEDEMSAEDSESEYIENNKRSSTKKKGKRPAKTSEILAKEEEYESEFADMRNASTGRASKIRQTRLVSERRRRDALSSAFVEIRCLLPPDVQKLPKSRILEAAADALKEARREAEYYKQLWLNLRERQAYIDAAGYAVQGAPPSHYPSHPH